MSQCLTPWEFERYDSGELALADVQTIRAHLDSCDACRTAHAQYRSDQTVAREPGSPPTPMDATQSLAPGTKSLRRRDSAPGRVAQHVPNIEGYQITGVLGQGGMGLVYRAVQTKLSRTVALKVLPAMVGTASPAAVSRFRREATSAARLHHTNIIPIYDFGESPDGYYYAMELITGQPLDAFIRRFSEQNASSATAPRLAKLLRTTAPEAVGLSTADTGEALSGSDLSTSGSVSSTGRGPIYYQHVARWMADTADALHYAHSQDVIHRDIKPGNLILSVDGRIMLADFGLAKSADGESVTMTGTLVGTLRYMSPEQSMAKRVRIDHRTDIYSLGATMYELLCFQPAFVGEDQKTILGAIISRDPTPPRKLAPAVPPELDTICLKCMEKSPDARYDTGQALAEDLLRYINDLPIAAKRPGPIRRTIKLIRRHKATSVAITAILLLFGAAGLGLRFHHQREVAQAESRKAQAEELISEGVRLHEQPTRTPASTRKKLIDAAKKYEAALKIVPSHWRALSNLARVKKDLFNNQTDPDPKLLEEAYDLCKRVLVVQEGDPRLWNQKGVLAKKLGRFDEAIEAYEKAIELEPDSVYWWDNLGVIQALTGDLDSAEESLRRASELAGVGDPCNVHAWRDLASLQFFLGRSEAGESIKQAIACGPTEPWSNVICAHLRLQPNASFDPPTALDDIKIAARAAGTGHPRVTRILALAYLRNDLFSDAVEFARSAIDLDDMPTINHLIIAIAEAKLGDLEALEAARNAYHAALAAWPSDLKNKGDFRASAPGGVLWFDTADELYRLREEAQKLIGLAVELP